MGNPSIATADATPSPATEPGTTDDAPPVDNSGTPQQARWRNYAAIGIVISGILVIAAFVLKPAGGAGVDSGVAAPLSGHSAPSFVLRTTSGEQVNLAALRGHVVVINFWFTNCPPCRTEMPTLQRMYDQMARRGVTILGVDAVGEDSQTIRAFTDALGVTYPLLVDPTSKVTRLYNVGYTPTSFFVDRTGIIRTIHVGQLSAGDISAGLKGLLD